MSIHFFNDQRHNKETRTICCVTDSGNISGSGNDSDGKTENIMIMMMINLRKSKEKSFCSTTKLN